MRNNFAINEKREKINYADGAYHNRTDGDDCRGIPEGFTEITGEERKQYEDEFPSSHFTVLRTPKGGIQVQPRVDRDTVERFHRKRIADPDNWKIVDVVHEETGEIDDSGRPLLKQIRTERVLDDSMVERMKSEARIARQLYMLDARRHWKEKDIENEPERDEGLGSRTAKHVTSYLNSTMRRND